jgi:hypothetical protein
VRSVGTKYFFLSMSGMSLRHERLLVKPERGDGGGGGEARHLPGAFSTMTGILSLYFSFIFCASFFRASRVCCKGS